MKSLLKIIIFKVLSRFIIKYGNSGSVYITFDDGPHPENTVLILDILKKQNIYATFFMSGSEIKKYPDIVKMVHSEGHTVGYHSFSHHSFKKISIFSVIKELSAGRSLAKKLGIKFNLFRPPYGDLTILSFLYLLLSGWKVVMWSLDSRDSFDSKEKVIELVDVEKLSDGEILLFHDDYILTAEILPDILKKYQAKGIRCKAL
ncbi:hypothetical protein MNBD_GAMMA09-230 [hydrothermal vent metagenome]|uniref:NodB homology domain-containing protein n=1 Tax=hydrothermal vent metagenome TaxID=652676 RepID=A0A3B0YC38_9ZZZZ